MHRTARSYYRDEAMRLGERRADVEQEKATLRARLVELDAEHALLDELLGALNAHVPDAEADHQAMRIA